jgi:AhpD family alkylhydroperoxidase
MYRGRVSSLRDVPWGECLLEPVADPEIERRIRAAAGGERMGATLRHFVAAPWVAEALHRLNRRVMTRVHLDHDLSDLAGLAVSQDNSCRYCYAAQRALLRILGFSESRIRRVEQDFTEGAFTPAEKAAIEYARKVSRANPLAVLADAEGLRREGFTEDAIRELAAQATIHVLFNRTSTLAALPPTSFEALPDRWWARWFRPALAPIARRFRHREGPVRLHETKRTGPYSFVVNALDGLSVAGELRDVVDAMDASPILARRCKALMFAVIARALGSERALAEATAMATGEGVSPAWVAGVVDHLSAPDLTPQESLLIPFARDTVWYESPRIQERARAVCGRLTREEFVEAIGVVSLANSLCRLAAAVVPP